MFSCVLWVIYVGARYGGGIADGINDYDIYFEQATWLSVSFLIGTGLPEHCKRFFR